MVKTTDIMEQLKKNHQLCIGEMTAGGIKQELSGISKRKIRISGRSYETGRKKTVHVRLVDLLRN